MDAELKAKIRSILDDLIQDNHDGAKATAHDVITMKSQAITNGQPPTPPEVEVTATPEAHVSADTTATQPAAE